MKRNRHRILLVEPPFYRLFKHTYSLDRYPLSLGYLSGTVRKETDWDVMVYNADFAGQSERMRLGYLTNRGFDSYLDSLADLSRPVWREIKSTILGYEPTAIGISAKSPNFASACIVARLAKEVNEQVIVIVGGPHPSAVGCDVLNCPHFDLGVKGEGENTIVELLDAIQTRQGFDSIQGIVHRKDGRIVETPPRRPIEDLDTLCFPYESAPEVLRDYERYAPSAFRNVFATRGCPYDCLFCGSRQVWGRKVRFRSPGNIVREIRGLQKMGVRLANFNDDVFGTNKEYLRDLCNALIVHCPGLKWKCYFHVRLADEQTISLMKAAGCCFIEIGIESGSNELLKEMGKNITIEEALSACEIIRKHGIQLQATFMIGFPQETEETLHDTVAAMKRIGDAGLVYSIFTPYPGTEAFKFCEENGLIGDGYDMSFHTHQSLRNCFCSNITPERFRILASEIERMVDRKNTATLIRQIFSPVTLRRIQELGIGRSLVKAMRILR